MNMKQQYEQLKKKVTDYIAPYKKWFNTKNDLLILFLEKYFGLRKLCYVYFEYDYQYAKQNPQRKTAIVLARVRRDADKMDVLVLFKEKSDIQKKITITVVKITISPVLNIPKV